MKLILSILSHHIKSSIELNFSEKQQQQLHRIHRILIDKVISVKEISNTDTARDKTNRHNKLTVNIGKAIPNRYLVHCIRIRTTHRREFNFKSTIRDQTNRGGHTHIVTLIAIKSILQRQYKRWRYKQPNSH